MNQVTEKPIRIEQLKFSSEDYPKYKYICNNFGQSAYILRECKKQGIAAIYFDGGVGIFAKTKIEDFIRIVQNSFRYFNFPNPTLTSNNAVYTNGNSLYGVIVKKYKNRSTGYVPIMYTTENHIEDIVINIFMKRIIKPNQYRIFKSKKELVSYLEKEFNLIV